MEFADAARMFLVATRGVVAATTHKNYTYGLSKLEPLGPCPLEGISIHELRIARSDLMDSYAVSSVNTCIRVWKIFFNWLIAEELLTHSPAGKLRYVKAPPAVKVADLSDVSRMIAEARQRRHFRDVAIMLILLSTGIRVSALCGMRLDDIDHIHSTVTVKEKGNRLHTVHLVNETYNAIAVYVNYERPATPAPFLFRSYRDPGKGIHSNTVLYMLRRYAEALNITTPVNPHSFRHLFTVTMMRNGASLDVVSKLLGHSSVSVTERFYAAWANDMLKEAHAKFNPVANLTL